MGLLRQVLVGVSQVFGNCLKARKADSTPTAPLSFTEPAPVSTLHGLTVAFYASPALCLGEPLQLAASPVPDDPLKRCSKDRFPGSKAVRPRDGPRLPCMLGKGKCVHPECVGADTVRCRSAPHVYATWEREKAEAAAAAAASASAQQQMGDGLSTSVIAPPERPCTPEPHATGYLRGRLPNDSAASLVPLLSSVQEEEEDDDGEQVSSDQFQEVSAMASFSTDTMTSLGYQAVATPAVWPKDSARGYLGRGGDMIRSASCPSVISRQRPSSLNTGEGSAVRRATVHLETFCEQGLMEPPPRWPLLWRQQEEYEQDDDEEDDEDEEDCDSILTGAAVDELSHFSSSSFDTFSSTWSLSSLFDMEDVDGMTAPATPIPTAQCLPAPLASSEWDDYDDGSSRSSSGGGASIGSISSDGDDGGSGRIPAALMARAWSDHSGRSAMMLRRMLDGSHAPRYPASMLPPGWRPPPGPAL